MPSLEQEIGRAIRNVSDYPKKGFVGFKDLTTLWKDGPLAKRTVDALYEYSKGRRPDKVVGIESRGFIVGAPLADRLGIGFVPARKPGKLPASKISIDYALEYGKDGLEIHADAISKGERVLIVDDLLATGGTSNAARVLVEKMGGKVVGFAFIVELTYLKGREKLVGYEVHSLVRYDTE
ncbi:MAG: adenine phosphoribosyltransferase [Nitrososphaerales archaeon]|nr:adenine phosphoribosyltransferase [Nitrososphaerales archaeon]